MTGPLNLEDFHDDPFTSQDNLVDDASEDTENIMIQTQDPHSFGANLSESTAFMNVIKANIGTGILSMPVVFKYTGIWLGLFLIGFCGLISTYCMRLLLDVSEEVVQEKDLDPTKIDYTDTVFYVLKYGPESLRKSRGKLKHTVNVFLIITQIGFCCAYIVFLSHNIQQILELVVQPWDKYFFIVGMVVTIVLMPLSLFKNMASFAKFAMAANFATLIALILIFVFCLATGRLHPWPELVRPEGFQQVLVGFSICVFAFEGISLMLPIRSKMRRPEVFTHWDGSLYMGMLVVVSLNALLGWIGYFRFGQQTEGSIAFNIPMSPWWVGPVKPLLVFAIMVTFLLQFYVPAAIFTRLMEKIPCHRLGSPPQRNLNTNLMRIGSVMVIYMLAMAINHLDLLLSLIGSFCSSMLAIVIPPALQLVHKWPRRHSMPNFKSRILLPYCVMIFFGLVAFIGGTVATVLQLIEVYSEPLDLASS